jgi:glycosyltransferase involved in cell wall biosynthesis
MIAHALETRRRPYGVITLNDSPLHRRLEAERLQALPVGTASARTATDVLRILRLDPDATVDAHSIRAQLVTLAARGFVSMRRPILTVHGVFRGEKRPMHRRIAYESVLRGHARLGARFVAVSRNVCEYLSELGVSQSAIDTIPNGVEPARRDLSARERLLSRTGWPVHAFIVTLVGRMDRVKGHRHLLHALRALHDTHPEIRCCLVGDGPHRVAVEAEVVRLGLTARVHFTGFVEKVGAFLDATDAFCLPSISEGLPFAVLEAAARGVPLLISAVGTLPDVFTHRLTALIVPPGDEGALARALADLLDDPASATAMGQAASELVRQRYGAEPMIERTLALYDQ